MALNNEFIESHRRSTERKMADVTKPYTLDLGNTAPVQEIKKTDFSTPRKLEDMEHWFREYLEVKTQKIERDSPFLTPQKLGGQVIHEYYNFSDSDIWVVDGLGMRMPIYPANTAVGQEGGVFMVKVTYSIRSNRAMVQTINELKAYKRLAEIPNSIVDEITVQLQNASNNFSQQTELSFIIVYRADVIKKQPIYCRDLNFALSAGSPIIHPNDPNFTHQRQMLMAHEKMAGCGVFFEVVDNESRYPSYYVHSAGESFNLKPVRDKLRESGVYYSRIETNNDGTEAERKAISIDDGISSGMIYTNEYDAKMNATPGALANAQDAANRKEIEALRFQTSKSKQEFESSKYEMERERIRAQEESDRRINQIRLESEAHKAEAARAALVREKELIELKAELARLEAANKIKSMERTDYYEGRSYERKDSSEFLKYALPLAAAAAGFFVANRK